MNIHSFVSAACLLLSLNQFTHAMAVEYTLKPGQVISIKPSSGQATYHFNSNGINSSFLRPSNKNKQNLQKRIYKCDRLLLAHQDAGLHKHHPEEYFQVEKLLLVSKDYHFKQHEEKAQSSIMQVEEILKNIERNYPDQNFSSIRNCFNLTRWEQCI
ncbi:MAG: hypothetical protein ACPGUE_07935 [Marinomonas sp.]